MTRLDAPPTTKDLPRAGGAAPATAGEVTPSGPAGSTARPLWNVADPPRIAWPLLALGLLLLFNAAFSPGFFSVEVRDGRLYGSLIDVLNRAAPVMLLAQGMALVIATGGIDLSVGAVMAIAGAVAACLIARPPGSPIGAVDVGGSLAAVVLIPLCVAAVLGLWNGLLVVLLRLQPIVATLILMVAGRGVAQLITNGQVVTFEHRGFAFLGGGSVLYLPVPVVIAAAVAAVTAVLARGTALGLFVEAVGNSPRAARLAGVPGATVAVVAYTFCGLCAGVAGLVAAADIRGADANNAGLYLELDAILAVSVGGTALTGGRFSLPGALVGAVLIQALTSTILTHGVPPALTLVVKGGVVVLVCLLQSPVFRATVRRLASRGDR